MDKHVIKRTFLMLVVRAEFCCKQMLQTFKSNLFETGLDIIISAEPLLKRKNSGLADLLAVSVLKRWSLLIIYASESCCCCCVLGINGECNVPGSAGLRSVHSGVQGGRTGAELVWIFDGCEGRRDSSIRDRREEEEHRTLEHIFTIICCLLWLFYSFYVSPSTLQI